VFGGHRIAVTSWLERSRQRWKTRNPWLAILVTAILVFVVGLVSNGGSPPLWTMMVMFVLAAGGRSAGFVLPLLVRCGVCGVRVATSSLGKRLPAPSRLAWMESLHACPVCGDDGGAAPESIRAWQASGRAPLAPKWSGGDVLVRVLTALFLIAIACFVLSRESR
jgi:hypothetical protein